MRRKDREVVGKENIERIIKSCKVCRLAMIACGKPYVVPMNFGYIWDDEGLSLYFHTGREGKKLDALKKDPRVCFLMDIEEGVVIGGNGPCGYSFAFSSIIGEGAVEFLESGEEKTKGLDAIMEHQTGRGGWAYDAVMLDTATVFKVHADSFEASVKLPKQER